MRLYYWYRGVEATRDYGPWWFKNFASEEELQDFLKISDGLLEAYSITDGSEEPRSENNRNQIQPPKMAVVQSLRK